MSTGRISDDLPRLSKKSLREPGVLDKLRYKLKNFKDKLKDGLKKFGEKISNWGSGDAKPTDGDGLAGQESSDGLGEQEDSPESGGLADRTAELGKVEAILEKDIKEGENLGDSGELNKAITEFAGQKNVEIENPEGKVTGYSDMDDGSRVTVQSSTLPEGWSDPATITEPEPIETGEEGFGEGGGLGGMEGGSFG